MKESVGGDLRPKSALDLGPYSESSERRGLGLLWPGWGGRSGGSKVRWLSRASRDSEPASEERVPDRREVCTRSAVAAGPLVSTLPSSACAHGVPRPDCFPGGLGPLLGFG